jgi:hypothetical protein
MAADRDSLESQWRANEAQLNRITAASGLDRELSAAEVERFEAQQDRIEWLIGFERPADAESHRWSGMA